MQAPYSRPRRGSVCLSAPEESPYRQNTGIADSAPTKTIALTYYPRKLRFRDSLTGDTPRERCVDHIETSRVRSGHERFQVGGTTNADCTSGRSFASSFWAIGAAFVAAERQRVIVLRSEEWFLQARCHGNESTGKVSPGPAVSRGLPFFGRVWSLTLDLLDLQIITLTTVRFFTSENAY
jgi:hypothetical protein